jgi:hypothetical protein
MQCADRRPHIAHFANALQDATTATQSATTLTDATGYQLLTREGCLGINSERRALQCRLAGGVGMILVQSQALDCVFRSRADGPFRWGPPMGPFHYPQFPLG